MKLVAEAVKFRKAILEATDEGLMILGESVGRTVYYHIERNHRVKREEIPDRLEAFHEALESIFGAGAIILEDRILGERGSFIIEPKGDNCVFTATFSFRCG